MHHHEREQTHHNHHNHHYHGSFAGNKSKFVVVIIFNILITISEYVGGVLSGSLALLSDASHNLSDVLSLMLGYAGESISEKPGGKRYTFGLKRFEVLIALINALSLLVIAAYIIYEAIERFKGPQIVDFKIMLPVAVIGLLGNVFSILVLAKNKEDSLNMKAAFLHLMYDAISSVAVIIAAIIIYFTKFYWIDLVVSLIIVIMIAWSSLSIVREAFRIFLQGAPKDIDIDKIRESICNIKMVESVHGLHVWSINSSEVFLSCHIQTDKNLTIEKNDEIIRITNKLLEDTYDIHHSTIQVEQDICKKESDECCR